MAAFIIPLACTQHTYTIGALDCLINSETFHGLVVVVIGRKYTIVYEKGLLSDFSQQIGASGVCGHVLYTKALEGASDKHLDRDRHKRNEGDGGHWRNTVDSRCTCTMFL